jgi:hypothetical protein
MLTRFDHVVLGVADLDGAARAFQDAGFDVFDRGGQAGPLRNRLIRFPDWSFIELVALSGSGEHRFREPIGRGDGWVDYALCVEGIAGVRRALGGAGVAVSDVRRVAQPAANGSNWEMDLLLAGLGVGSPALPFLTEDLTPLDWRLPPLGRGREQLEGAAGIAGATVVVSSLSPKLPGLVALCGAPAVSASDAASGLVSARFDFNGHWLEVVVPEEGTEEAAHLAKRGEGPFSVTLRSRNAEPRRLAVGDAFGAALFL